MQQSLKFMNSSVFYILPFVYFLKTRMFSFKHFVFHFYYEWIPGIALLFISSGSLSSALLYFAVLYLVFISFYELGYLLNDHYSVKHEKEPRLRSKTLTKTELLLFLILRITLFSFLVWYKDLWLNKEFIIFYAVMGIVFIAHNILKVNEYKILTFIGLATFRFFAPFVFFIPANLLKLIFPSVLIMYVFYRAFTYMESKSVLVIPGRKNGNFKLAYYSLLIPISLLLSLFFKAYLPLIINFYFLIFWLAFKVFEKNTNEEIE